MKNHNWEASDIKDRSGMITWKCHACSSIIFSMAELEVLDGKVVVTHRNPAVVGQIEKRLINFSADCDEVICSNIMNS